MSILSDLRHFFDTSKRRLLEEFSTGTYVVKEMREGSVDPRLVIYTDPKSHVAEQYRIMRTNMKFLSPDKKLRSFVFTSALRGEGKTVTSCNISFSSSQEPDNKVILEENMVLTVEPGVYITNFGGVRIEDDILVKQDGVEVLTKSPRNLIEI